MLWEDKQFIGRLKLKGLTLDVGSLDINGNIKNLCERYIGVDLQQGKNVDVVANGWCLPFKDESMDNVVSLGTLEHDADFFCTVDEMKRVLKKGGLLVISVPAPGFGEHRFPKDYWRFNRDGVELLLSGCSEITIEFDKKRLMYRGYGRKK